MSPPFQPRLDLPPPARRKRGVILRPASEADWPLISRWLARPDIEDWWGPAASTEAEIRLALEQTAAISRIIEVDGVAVGYAHAVDAAIWGEALPDDLAPGTWDLDIFIASETHRGQGVGQTALRLLRDEVFETTLAIAVAVFPSIANERAVRAYERAGFHAKRVLRNGAYGLSWFMVAERSASITS